MIRPGAHAQGPGLDTGVEAARQVRTPLAHKSAT